MELKCQAHSDMRAVLPRIEKAAIGICIVIMQSSAMTFSTQVDMHAGWMAVRAEETEPKSFRQDMLDHAAFCLVPVVMDMFKG